MKTKLTILAAGAGLSLLAASLAGATPTNLVTNGDFSDGMTEWDDWFPSLSNIYVTSDEHLFIQGKTAKAEGHFHSVSRCIQSIPSAPEYTMSADVLFPPNQGRNGRAHVRVQSYAAALCNSPSAVQTDPQVLAASGWQDVTYQIDAPAGTQSFRITLAVETWAAQPGQDPNTTLWAEFDNVSIVADVADDPTPPADPTQDPPADPTQDPPADPTQDPPADPTQDPGDPPADPTQDPGDPPADPTQDPPDGPVASVTPAVPPKPKFPDFPEDPVDVFVPGPSGGTPEPATTPAPADDEPQDPPQPEHPTPEVPSVQPPLDDSPTATPTPAPPEPTVAVVVADATPLPPSSGTGVRAGEQGTNLAFLAGLALTAVAATTAAASAAGERMKRR